MTTDRVVVIRPIIGICYMQVCVVKDATDEEILAVCNRENPSGTSNGWTSVCRDLPGSEARPCADDRDRLHILVAC